MLPEVIVPDQVLVCRGIATATWAGQLASVTVRTWNPRKVLWGTAGPGHAFRLIYLADQVTSRRMVWPWGESDEQGCGWAGSSSETAHTGGG